MPRFTTRHIRRLKTFVGAVALAAGAALVIAPAASATTAPFPAGTFTIDVAAAISLTHTAIGPTTINITGTMHGTSDGAGHITIPKGNMSFPPVNVTIVVPAVVTAVADTNFTGTINTTTGAVTMNGSLSTFIAISALSTAGNGCELGPIAFDFSTAHTGGVKYKKVGTHATATVSDTAFTIPSIPAATADCPAPAQTTINSALFLPATNNASVTQALTIFPPGVTAPTTTTSTSTTVPVKAGAPTVEAGKTITVTGNGWKPGSKVTVLLTGNSTPLGTATVDANGAFTATVTIPSDTPAGSHTITISGTAADGSARTVASGTITVTAILPATGGDTGPLTLIGVALISAGAVMLAPRRRRSTVA